MYSNKRKITIRIVLPFVMLLMFTGSASAVAITDFFSDFTSSDVTVSSSQDLRGRAVFELSYSGSTVESHEVPITVGAGEAVTKVIIWEKKPQQDYYTARVSIYNDSQVLASRAYQVSYGTVSLPSFHVVDFSPTNSGAKLLLRPFNPSVADIKIQLLDNNDIIYEKANDDTSLTANTEIITPWTFLLTNNKNYTVRAKIFTHRLYAAPLINTYISNFTATEDVGILPDDVKVDEYGASVTIRGKSQVPFDGYLVVENRNRATNGTQTYSVQLEDILVSGKETTAGVVWKGLVPGIYDVVIRAEDNKNITADKYETVLRIPEYTNATATATAKGTPGFTAYLLIAVLLAAARRQKGG
ncbi:MAG: hypothetical protein OIN66_10750 [Candidatus Methanoperedens sp.]|nr:hypothetical protein [Candidatus Methanoperedens sp.]